VARRFVVDASAPELVFVSPVMNSVVTPGSEIPVSVVLIDSSGNGSGSGIVTDDLEVVLTGPEGEVFRFNPAEYDPGDTAVAECVKDVVLTSDKLEMLLTCITDIGAYNLSIEGADASGNSFVASHDFNAGASVLGIREAYVYPNPVNPEVAEATIHLFIDGQRETTVRVKIFDFAGDLVAELPALYDQRGAVSIPWACATGDGTPVANGGYLAHIAVDDGAAVKTANVKIAVRKD